MWINDEITLDFDLPAALLPLVHTLEKLAATENYAYFNYAEALDDAAKELIRKGVLTQSQWDQIAAKYIGG